MKRTLQSRKRPFRVFLSLQAGGQKSLRRESRKRMNSLAQIFGFRWSARYTFEPLGREPVFCLGVSVSSLDCLGCSFYLGIHS